jgi:hypothetical protein
MSQSGDGQKKKKPSANNGQTYSSDVNVVLCSSASVSAAAPAVLILFHSRLQRVSGGANGGAGMNLLKRRQRRVAFQRIRECPGTRFPDPVALQAERPQAFERLRELRDARVAEQVVVQPVRGLGG